MAEAKSRMLLKSKKAAEFPFCLESLRELFPFLLCELFGDTLKITKENYKSVHAVVTVTTPPLSAGVRTASLKSVRKLLWFFFIVVVIWFFVFLSLFCFLLVYFFFRLVVAVFPD